MTIIDPDDTTSPWTPDLSPRTGPLYRRIVAALDADLAAGRLRPGDRLPTQRELGAALGVAVGTVTRAYAEAEQRGLIRGEIGRGTFVEGRMSVESLGDGGASSDEAGGLIDLSVNLPVYSEDPDLGATLRQLGQRDDLSRLLHYQAHAGMPHHRRAGALWARRFGLVVEDDAVLVCAGIQNALTVAFSAITEPGDLIFTEELTYPGVKAVARLLNLRLEGIAMDGFGMVPEALEKAVVKRRGKAVYLIPTLHNPTSAAMPEARRRAIAEIAARHGLAIVEDDADRLLVDDAPPPISTLLPERSYFIAGMSKAVSGGLRIAYLVAPPRRVESVAQGLWATHWMVAPLMAEIASLWIEDGTAERVVARKRTEAAARQALARQILRGLPYSAHPHGYHAWIELPAGWHSVELVIEARRRGVAVTPAETFLVGAGPAPAAVRACLGAPRERATVRAGLIVLAEILGRPEAASAIV